MRDSGIENSGQGLFTKQTIKAGEIVALFNGVRKASSRYSHHTNIVSQVLKATQKGVITIEHYYKKMCEFVS